MRLFLALEIATAMREALANIAADLKSEATGARWSKPESLHVTLKFLGSPTCRKLRKLGRLWLKSPLRSPFLCNSAASDSSPMRHVPA
jgi:2'-5' RNA ligase